MNKQFLLSLVCCTLAFFTQAGSEVKGKYAPGKDKVLMFVGQDNLSVGGNAQWRDGYIDHIGVPAGITHYVYFSENKTNPFGAEFDTGTVDGLNKTADWKAGPMCLRCYLESEKLKDTVIHLSISMEHDDEPSVANGDYDHNIQELADLMEEFSHIPFYLRIGYEFDGSWNSYEPEAFKKAWRRIVDKLRARGIDNFATVLASYNLEAEYETWETYWPGDEYVDWLGYSYWFNGSYNETTLAYAREKGLPVMIAEVTPRGFVFDRAGSGRIWTDWFEHFFRHIEANLDVIKAVSYINADWDSQKMWHDNGWGNTKIQDNDELKEKWLAKMAEDTYIHTVEGTYEAIGFKK